MENLKSAAKKAVGTKAVLRALASKEAARVYVASDIDTFLYQKVTRACADAAVPVRKVESNKELGVVCGVEVATASAAIVR